MIESKEQYLEQLEKGLKDHPKKQIILMEYDLHITEMLNDLPTMSEHQSEMDLVMERLGSPAEILESWNADLSITPNKAKWNFVLINIIFFSFGIVLTVLHNLFAWDWTKLIWGELTSISGMIIFLYILFWMMLGYEIGKAFGPSGKKLMLKTFLLSIIPNLVLMYLILFKIIPHEWFQPLLNKDFILICVSFTLILYPICAVGYYWGKKASIH